MEDTQTTESATERIYTPQPGELQLTVRAVVSGCLIGSVVGCMNIYLGLKIGWTVGGSLLAAILGFGLFQLIRPKTPFGVLETNITQTTGSAAGTMASAGGFVAAIPALLMLSRVKVGVISDALVQVMTAELAGDTEKANAVVMPWVGLLDIEIPLPMMFVWAVSIAYLGVFFAVPLRRQYIEVENLRFPTGTATAETIKSMFATAGEAVAQARALLIVAVIAGVWTFIGYFFPITETPPLTGIDNILPWAVFGTLSAYTFSIVTGPMLFGAGFIVGTRVAASLFVGAIVSWGILGPLAEHQGWVTGPVMSYKTGARGWILWPGVAIMAADALTSLALSWRTILNTFKRRSDKGSAAADPDAIPNSWWMGGLAVASLATVIIASLVFDIAPHLSIIAILLSSVLAAIAVRSTGETDINPIGGMGKVTQLVFGGVAPGQVGTNLMAAAIAGAGASQAGDMMQDLKTGHMLGASPRKQFIAQLWGVGFGVLAVVPIFFLFDAAYDIGTGKLGAPAAHAWRAMAEVLGNGLGSLPPHAGWTILGGVLFGVTIPVLRKTVPKLAKYLPNGLAFGIAFIVQAYYSIEMFLGALVFLLWKRRNKSQAERFVFSIAAGMIAGEGLIGVLKAVLTLTGVDPLIAYP